ncbi:MAG TPA: hypothetical protein VJ999_08490 [Candidatus Sulfotelmatobacter sp.]|nr:hypothetical protein [Candidatus Sulfotelmatobacter sp.]
MRKAIPARLVAGFVLLLAASHYQLFAQSPECPPSKVLLSASDPAYADAMDLAITLEAHGFTVRCMFPTKLGSIFQVADGDVLRSTIEGEANFSTNYGAFDVIFMPKPQTFADFRITERRSDGGYLYRFTGTPRVLAGNKFKFGTATREHFLKHDNHLLLVSDDNLRARLEEALHLPPQAP